MMNLEEKEARPRRLQLYQVERHSPSVFDWTGRRKTEEVLKGFRLNRDESELRFQLAGNN